LRSGTEGWIRLWQPVFNHASGWNNSNPQRGGGDVKYKGKRRQRLKIGTAGRAGALHRDRWLAVRSLKEVNK